MALTCDRRRVNLRTGSAWQSGEEILRLVAEWQTNTEIGRRLALSELTVKNHVSSILGKLEVSRRTEAAA